MPVNIILLYSRILRRAYLACTEYATEMYNPLSETYDDSFGRFTGADRNVLIWGTWFLTALLSSREEETLDHTVAITDRVC